MFALSKENKNKHVTSLVTKSESESRHVNATGGKRGYAVVREICSPAPVDRTHRLCAAAATDRERDQDSVQEGTIRAHCTNARPAMEPPMDAASAEA